MIIQPPHDNHNQGWPIYGSSPIHGPHFSTYHPYTYREAGDSYLQSHPYTLTSNATPTPQLAEGNPILLAEWDPILLAEWDPILLYFHRHPYAKTARRGPYTTLVAWSSNATPTSKLSKGDPMLLEVTNLWAVTHTWPPLLPTSNLIAQGRGGLLRLTSPLQPYLQRQPNAKTGRRGVYNTGRRGPYTTLPPPPPLRQNCPKGTL